MIEKIICCRSTHEIEYFEKKRLFFKPTFRHRRPRPGRPLRARLSGGRPRLLRRRRPLLAQGLCRAHTAGDEAMGKAVALFSMLHVRFVKCFALWSAGALVHRWVSLPAGT